MTQEKSELDRAQEVIDMTKKLLATDPSDLLLMIRQAPNERIKNVLVLAYRERCKTLLSEALK